MYMYLATGLIAQSSWIIVHPRERNRNRSYDAYYHVERLLLTCFSVAQTVGGIVVTKVGHLRQGQKKARFGAFWALKGPYIKDRWQMQAGRGLL